MKKDKPKNETEARLAKAVSNTFAAMAELSDFFASLRKS